MRTGGNFEMRKPGKFLVRRGGKVDANVQYRREVVDGSKMM